MSSLNIVLKNADFSKVAVKQVEVDMDIPVTGITLDGNPTNVNSQGNKANFSALFIPASTTHKKVDWTLKGGSNSGTTGNGYSSVNGVASIDRGTGLLTVLSGANASKVTVVCTSIDTPSVKAEWDVSLTYQYKDMRLSYLNDNMTEEKALSFSVSAGKTISFAITGGGYINNGTAQVRTITVTNTDGTDTAYNGTYKIKLNKGDIIAISNPQNLSAIGALYSDWSGGERFVANSDLYFEDPEDVYLLSNVVAFAGISFKDDATVPVNNVFNNIQSLVNRSVTKKLKAVKVAIIQNNGTVQAMGADIQTLEITDNVSVNFQSSVIRNYTLAEGKKININFFVEIQASDSVVQKMFADGNYTLNLPDDNKRLVFVDSTFNATTIALLKKIKVANTELAVTVNDKDVDTL